MVQLVEALRYRLEGLGFDSRWFHWNYSLTITMTVHRLRAESALNRCTVQPFTENDDTRCCENKICPPEDGHVNARNMLRIVV